MSDISGRISQIQRFCAHDGPGIRTTAFLTGCPLRCAWCHNPECSLYADRTCSPDSPLSSVKMTARDIALNLCRDEPFYGSQGGVTLSGGEPLVQPAFAREILRLCKKQELHTAVETSLCASWEDIGYLLPLVSLWIVDVKTMDAQKHRQYTGCDNGVILDNLERLMGKAEGIWVRMPIVPGVQTCDDVYALSYLLGKRRAVKNVELIPFHLLGREKYRKLGVLCPYPSDCEPDTETMQALKKILLDAGLPVDHTYK